MAHTHQPQHGPLAAGAEIYPAGAAYARGHHGHTIVPKRLLVGILGVLLAFTLLTVGAAKSEEWIAHTFHVDVPQWVNVSVALSIAVIKSVIVALYFMQLRYDNPMNGVVAVFTIFVLSFFLGFTMLDMDNRGTLYADQAREIKAGGTWGGPDMSIADQARASGVARIEQLHKDGQAVPEFLVHFAVEEAQRLEAENKPVPEAVKAVAAHAAHPGHGEEEDGGPVRSDANASRPRTGLTLPGLVPSGAQHGAPATRAEPATPSH